MSGNTKSHLVIFLIGIPGSGKSFFARNWSQDNDFFHLSADRIRKEITDHPNFTREEDASVENVHDYIFDLLVQRGESVVVDSTLNTRIRRQKLRSLAKKYGAETLVVWVQTDAETALNRSLNKDRRNPDDKYSAQLDEDTFMNLSRQLSKPQHEEYVVISGKHLFTNQKNAVNKKLKNTKVSKVSLGGRVNSSRRTKVQ